jgi:hypothetical protein
VVNVAAARFNGLSPENRSVQIFDHARQRLSQKSHGYKDKKKAQEGSYGNAPSYAFTSLRTEWVAA